MDLLKKTLNMTAVCALTATMAFVATDVNAETVTGNASLTVQNAFTLVETTPLSFGTKVTQNDTGGALTATLAMSVLGVETIINNVPAQFINITAGSQGVYDVTAAVPSTAITVTLPTTSTLTCGACVTTPPDIVASAFVDDSVAGVITTDVAGLATLNVGATLTTEASNPTIYEDGVYAGTFIITMNY